LSERGAKDRLRLAIDVADPAIADRIASALADAEMLELVGKDDEPDVLVVAVAQLGAATEQDVNVGLTARELEVLALLAEGASNKLIARRLGISAHTAKYHVASLLEKLDAVSRTDAVAHAARIGVLHF
jgi:DNA-binding CsgD family transcriptional regulator